MSKLYEPLLVEPKIKTIFFNHVKKECFSVMVSGEEYVTGEQSAEWWWSKSKPGFYGQGLANSKEDGNRTIRTGVIGEIGFGKIFNLPIDLGYVKNGKDQDFIIGPNETIDVKTATYNYGCVCIQAINEKKIKIPLKADIYVGGFLQNEDRNKKSVEVIFVGYIKKEFINPNPVKARKEGATHMNYEVPYKDLQPIKLLLKAHKRYIERTK